MCHKKLITNIFAQLFYVKCLLGVVNTCAQASGQTPHTNQRKNRSLLFGNLIVAHTHKWLEKKQMRIKKKLLDRKKNCSIRFQFSW